LSGDIGELRENLHGESRFLPSFEPKTFPIRCRSGTQIERGIL